MKIATWNLERPKHSSAKNATIIDELRRVNADVLILTETNSVIDLSENYKYFLPSRALSNPGDSNYTNGENRTTIWSAERLSPAETYDGLTSVRACIQTRAGNLNVYGTVIGPRGNRHKSFMDDLEAQIGDWSKICDSGAICIAGDFNLSFHDSYYFTKAGRTLMCDFFKKKGITILTCGVRDNIDHIAVSSSFLESVQYTVNSPWNIEKKQGKPRLSDHIGISVSLQF